MSRENVESFERGVEALNRGDVEAVLEERDPAVEFHAVLEISAINFSRSAASARRVTAAPAPKCHSVW